MVKKKHSWGKGYTRRQHEAQTREAVRDYYGRKQGRPMAKVSMEEWAEEAEELSWQQKAQRYRNAWESEKLINKTYSRDWEAILAHQAQQRKAAAFHGALVGIATGLALGLIIAAYLL